MQQMELNVDVWLRGTDFARTQIISGIGVDPAAWTDNDVSKLLKAMLLSIHRAKNPESTDTPVYLRGFSWIVNPFEENGVVVAQGQNLIQGFTGYVSIAQAGFMGVGAYGSTLLSVKLGWPVWLTMALAPLITAVLAMFVGYPSLRVKGHYALAHGGQRGIGDGVPHQVTLRP